MPRRTGADLLPLDNELEKTLRNLKNERAAEVSVMAEQRDINQNIPATAIDRRQQRQRKMQDFWRPLIREEYSAVRQPPTKENNFELKPALITMVQ